MALKNATAYVPSQLRRDPCHRAVRDEQATQPHAPVGIQEHPSQTAQQPEVHEPRRDAHVVAVTVGERLFAAFGCTACHLPSLPVDAARLPGDPPSSIAAYTDLLLHDMGERLADGRPDGLATGREWRTAPLWGIGLSETVNGHTRFLHDGRARNLAEAVLWHGGEAEAAKEAFRTASADQRAALIAFLNSL